MKLYVFHVTLLLKAQQTVKCWMPIDRGLLLISPCTFSACLMDYFMEHKTYFLKISNFSFFIESLFKFL